MALLPILLAVFAGLAVGVLRRGRLRSLALTRVRHPEFLAVAIGCSLFVDVSDTGPSGAIALVGLIGGIFFAGVNFHLAGMGVITIGIVANLLPVALNGSMPVRAEALVEAELVSFDELDRVSLSGARELESDDTLLAFLGDTYPVRWTGQVVSIGDLIMMVGLADVITHLMRQRGRRRLPAGALKSLGEFGWHEEDDILDLDDLERPIDIREPDLVDLRTGTSFVVAVDPQPEESTSTNPAQD